MEILNLIPGIPDEIAQECLIRVPLGSFPSVRHVCRQWKQEVESNSFHSLRKASGMTQKAVIAAQCEPCIIPASEVNNPKLLAPTGPIKYHLAVFYPDSGEWIRLPMIPGIPIGIPLFCHLAPVGHKLVMLGGWNPQSWAATDWVLVFDFMTGAWHRGASIPTPLRSFFACAVHENLVFIAGGHDGEKNATNTAMAYDVSSDRWIPLPNMSIERDEPKGMFLDGKFVVAGGYVTAEQGRFRRSAEMFDPVSWTWGPVLENWLDEDVKSTHTCMASNGKCYKLREDRYLVVREDDGWRVVGEIPEDARASTRIADAGNQRIAVVGSTYHAGIPVAYLAIEEAGKAVTWQRMEMPPEFWGHIQGICSMEL